MSKYLILLFIPFFAFAQIGSTTRVGKFDQLDSNTEPLIEVLKELEAMTTGAWKLPSGDTSERPVGEPSMIRYNSELETFEGYTTEWGPIAGGGGGLAMWMTGEEYIEDESVIWEPLSLKIYVANTTHTAGATFAGDIANWDELSNPFDATNLNITGNSLISTDTNGAVNIAPNGTGDATVTFDGTTVQTLDRQVEVGELIPNNGFERADISAVSCTNATITRVGDVAGGEFNDWALQITATGTPWSCDIDGAGGQGTGFAQLQSVATVGADAEFCILANGVEQACHQSNILTSKSETFSLPTVLDGTENSIRIKGTSASNVVTADKASMKAGLLTTTGYYREAILDLSTDPNKGSFTGGLLKVIRDGNTVHINPITDLTHASASSVNSADNLIPEWARPEPTDSGFKMNVPYFQASGYIQRFFARTSGRLDCSYVTFAGASSNQTSCIDGATLTYPVAEAQTVQSFNSMVYGSFARAANTSAQAIGSTDVKLSYPNSQELQNVTVTTNSDFTIQQSGWYKLQAQGVFRLTVDNTNTNAFNSLIKVNSITVATSGTSTLRREASVTNTAIEAPFSNFYEGYLTKGDVVTFHAIRGSANGTPQVNGNSSVSISRIMNPNGEPVSAVIKNEFVSGGAEQVVAGETWDGEQVYRRCYEITSDISTSTTIDTIPTGLNPIDAINRTGGTWVIKHFSRASGAAQESIINYISGSGAISVSVFSGEIVGAGTRFCMKYLK